MTSIPRIDPSVKHVTHGQLRRLTPEELSNGMTYVVEQTAVLVPYDVFQTMQQTIDRGERRIQELEIRLDAADAARRTLGQMAGART